jgi:hypothetical protein
MNVLLSVAIYTIRLELFAECPYTKSRYTDCRVASFILNYYLEAGLEPTRMEHPIDLTPSLPYPQIVDLGESQKLKLACFVAYFGCLHSIKRDSIFWGRILTKAS